MVQKDHMECGIRSGESVKFGLRSAECGVKTLNTKAGEMRNAESVKFGLRSAECGVKTINLKAEGFRNAECGMRSENPEPFEVKGERTKVTVGHESRTRTR